MSAAVLTKNGNCLDVCTDPICGDPDCLTVLTPVVYDELGINLCRNIPLEPPSTNVESISVQVMDITFETCGDAAVSAVPISGRPNCYLVTLTNLQVGFFRNIFTTVQNGYSVHRPYAQTTCPMTSPPQTTNTWMKTPIPPLWNWKFMHLTA